MGKRLFSSMLLAVLVPATVAMAGTTQTLQTGQVYCYNGSGGSLSCTGSGQDAEYKKGAALPTSRYFVNGNGTVTDTTTGLVWLQKTDCTDVIAGAPNPGTWKNALDWSNNLADGFCNLTDGSKAGDWRLPNQRELMSHVVRAYFGTGLNGFLNTQGFSGVTGDSGNYYWTSTTFLANKTNAIGIRMGTGNMFSVSKTTTNNAWAVRDPR